MVVVVVDALVVVVLGAVVVAVPTVVVVTAVVVVVALLAWSDTMVFTVVVLGGSGVTPLGTKAIVTRISCANLMDEGLVVTVGFVWLKDVQ